MKKRCRLSRWQTVALIMADVVPFLALVMGVFLLVANTLFTFSWLFAYILLPLGAFVWNWFLITGSSKSWIKWTVCILLLTVFGWLFLTVNQWGHFKMLDKREGEELERYYSKDTAMFSCMPELDSLGQPQNMVYYYYYEQSFCFFTDDAYILICTYSPEDYLIQKQRITEGYVFVQEPFYDRGDVYESIDGYDFCVLDFYESSGYNLEFPKKLMLIATNDETGEIVYLAHYDDDLDYIPSYRDFIMNSCGWKYIR